MKMIKLCKNGKAYTQETLKYGSNEEVLYTIISTENGIKGRTCTLIDTSTLNAYLNDDQDSSVTCEFILTEGDIDTPIIESNDFSTILKYHFKPESMIEYFNIYPFIINLMRTTDYMINNNIEDLSLIAKSFIIKHGKYQSLWNEDNFEEDESLSCLKDLKTSINSSPFEYGECIILFKTKKKHIYKWMIVDDYKDAIELIDRYHPNMIYRIITFFDVCEEAYMLKPLEMYYMYTLGFSISVYEYDPSLNLQILNSGNYRLLMEHEFDDMNLGPILEECNYLSNTINIYTQIKNRRLKIRITASDKNDIDESNCITLTTVIELNGNKSKPFSLFESIVILIDNLTKIREVNYYE